MLYGEKLLFAGVNLQLSSSKRYALVGANGAGKSTLLQLMMGTEIPSEGEISIPKRASVGWLKQDQFQHENTRVVDVVIQGKPELWQALQQKDALLASQEWNDEIAHHLGDLEEIINHHDGYSAEAFAEKLLVGLGVSAHYHTQPLKVLSGGFKLRVLLAQSLFQQPDILLLDEPTNHLDILSIDWLEKYLKTEFSGLLLFISHDQEFIDRLADNILDIDYGEIRLYSSPFSKFLSEKTLIETQKLHEKKHVEEKVASLQAFVDRFKAKASKAKQAQSRVKMIEKIETPDIKHSSRLVPYFHFNLNRNPGKRALRVTQLSKRFEDRLLFHPISFDVQRGEKLAIAGANGSGKSTLIKMLLDIVKPDSGEVEWGFETHRSYFSQDHHDELNQSESVFEWLRHRVHNKSETVIRKILGHALFTQDDAHKNILTLSGGEAARLLIARMMLEDANVLILDEPTNHMDLEAVDALAHALRNYSGTVLVVSHNRYFINQIANRVLFISQEKRNIRDFRGTYQAFEGSL